jgi:hypothetical protein
MYAVSLAFQRRMQDPFPALFRINQQSQNIVYAGAELTRPYLSA